jgi:hypothetical protein
MSSQEKIKLNHYPEFKTDKGINDIIKYIKDKILPSGLNKRQKARYLEKYDDKDFKVLNGKLFYNPSDKLNLEVVKPVDREKRIKEIYDDPKRGLGLGFLI